jgi:hypothetical protein
MTRIKGVRRQKNRVFGTLPVSKRVSGPAPFSYSFKKIDHPAAYLILMGKE